MDMLLMSEADALVGKFTSNVDRLAFSLLVARRNGLVHYISLDSAWCADWGEPAGHSAMGTFFC